MAKDPRPRILVIHGPNLNLLGQREPDIYGCASLESIDRRLKEMAAEAGASVETFQSNHEGALVEAIQKAMGSYDVLIINPAGFTHTSVALRDAIIAAEIPTVEVHLSNIFAREEFRRHSVIADVVAGHISGLGEQSYYLALNAALELYRARARE